MTTSGLISGTMTAQELVTAAMQELGLISAGEQPTSEEGELGMQRLTWMLKSWQAQGMNLWRDQEFTITFPIDTATVTLDPIVIDVPEARLVQTSTFERPLQRWENGQYRSIPNKAQSGTPTAFYIDKQRDAVTMTLWPVPFQEYDVIFTGARVIEDVTELTQTIDAPQMWMETIWTCLAERLAPAFGVTRIDPQTFAFVKQKADGLYQQMLDQDRPASIFMGSQIGRQSF